MESGANTCRGQSQPYPSQTTSSSSNPPARDVLADHDIARRAARRRGAPGPPRLLRKRRHTAGAPKVHRRRSARNVHAESVAGGTPMRVQPARSSAVTALVNSASSRPWSIMCGGAFLHVRIARETPLQPATVKLRSFSDGCDRPFSRTSSTVLASAIFISSPNTAYPRFG
jgi:hypothetical protein